MVEPHSTIEFREACDRPDLSPHEAVIAALASAYSHGQQHRFGAALRSICEDEEDWKTAVQPDFYLIDRDAKRVTVFEVEDTSALLADKLHSYVEIFFLLEEYEWSFRLLVFDRWGNAREINILFSNWIEIQRRKPALPA